MAGERTDAEQEGKQLRIERRNGAVWAVRAGQEFCLGPAEEADPVMADYLTEVDFAE